MLRAGRTETLTVSRISDYGIYLADEEQQEVLLPNRYTSLSDKIGDKKEVFIYHDSEDRLVATTETSRLEVGEVGFLRVVDKTPTAPSSTGAFTERTSSSRTATSRGAYSSDTNTSSTSTKTTSRAAAWQPKNSRAFVNNELISVKPRQQVSILVASESPIGFRVVINNRHWGMIYRNQIFQPVAVGDRLTAYVARITDDNRIDLCLQQSGLAQVRDSAEVLLRLLRENGGELPLNDDSDPETVRNTTRMSKKVFKRSLGMLLKRGLVEIGPNGTKLKENKTL